MIVRHVKPKGRPCSHRVYALTCDEFEALRERANDRCELCSITAEESSFGVLHIDHEGAWGWLAKVRGLLCGRCNTGLDLPTVVPPERRAAYVANAFHLTLPPRRPPGVPSDIEQGHLDRLEWLSKLYRLAGADTRRAARRELHEAIWCAYEAGLRQSAIAKASGYRREHVHVLIKARRSLT